MNRKAMKERIEGRIKRGREGESVREREIRKRSRHAVIRGSCLYSKHPVPPSALVLLALSSITFL